MTTKTRPILTAALLIAALTACSPAATPAPEAGLPQAAYATAAPAATQVAPHGASAEGLASLVPPGANRMVIKDATLSLEVTTLATAVSTITQLAADQGGYVLETSTQGSDVYQTASLRIAVPADRFESTLERLRTLSNRVLSEQGSGQDVSAEYVDLETRLNNLEATSARVREFLAEAKTVEESLNVNAELSQLEGEIAQIKGQLQYYEGRAAFSTIGIALSLAPTTAEPTPTPVWDPAVSLERASSTAGRLTQGLLDVVIFVAVGFAPLWIPGVLVLGGLVWFGRRASRAGRAATQGGAKNAG